MKCTAKYFHYIRLRKLHECPPVRVDPLLVQKAQTLANRMALSQTITTFGDPTVGENFYLNIGRPSVSGKSYPGDEVNQFQKYACLFDDVQHHRQT
ncbi:hypothetical protein X801_08007 [Opisthorchis viverrini]|uniref:SCP domain-containing protein n=1 Tax=Opisthorchis viverrini TaxID=6198 RepID=A0A1S8WPN0_OPIVI|nr:hypothetical protein X801_08007 [Opisthorchis viverrini]